MSETKQVNIRVPDEARDVLARIGARLRTDPGFVAQLESYLDTLDDQTADATLADRVARIEAHLGITPTDNPPGTPPEKSTWTTGEGRGRRLTPAGEKDIELRIGAGQTDADIAAAMGISLNAVKARRKVIDERLL